ncbi:putative ribonuclease H-like domain-containing protein [Tanacetum coccineum]
MRPSGCHVTILNTLDSLGKFDGKSHEGFFVGYSLSSKAFRVYNTRTKRVEENLHIRFLESKPMIEGNGQKWLFDIDSLTQSMNYVRVAAGTITKESADASYFDSPSKDVDNGEPKSAVDDQKQVEDGPDNENDEKDKSDHDNSHMEVNTTRQHVNTGRFKLNIVDPSVNTASSYDQDSPKDMFKMGASHTLKATHVEFFSDEDKPEVDLGNITNSYTVPTTSNTRIHKDRPITNVIGDVKSSVQTRRITKPTSEQGFLNDDYKREKHMINPEYLFVWKLVDLPNGKRAIRTKWVFKNKKDERGIVIRNKASNKMVFAYASFMGFLVYQMDVKSAFLYGTIREEVYVTQPLGFKDPNHPSKVYKVVKALYGLHQAPRAWRTYFLLRITVDLEKPLVKDGDADDVDVHLYRSMIRTDVNLQTSRPEYHGLRSYVALCPDSKLISWQCKKQTMVATSTTEAEYVAAASCCRQDKHIEYLMLKASPLKSCLRGGYLCQYAVKHGWKHMLLMRLIHKELVTKGKGLATTALSLRSRARTVVPRYHIGGVDAQTRFETTSKQSNDPPLSRVNTHGSGEDSMKLMELMAHCTTLSKLNLNSLSIHQIASLEFCDKHNMVAYLEKSEGSEGFHQIIDFLTASHIKNALTKCPTLYASPIEQFWQTAALSTKEDGVRGITATIDKKVKVFVSEASIRRHLKLEDYDGISSLLTVEIFKQLALMGFIQIFLNKRKRMLFPHKRTFPTPTLTQKLFSNMKRASKGYSGVDIPLFPRMLTTPKSSPSRITSSPSLSPQTHPLTSQPPSTPPSNQTTPITEEAAPMPHESPLQSVYSLGRDKGSLSLNELTDLCTSLSKKVESLESELKQTKQTYHVALTKLIKWVKKLEQTIKIIQARRRAKVVISNVKEDEEDPFKQGKSLIEELDLDARIYLVPPHAADQGRIDDTQIRDQPDEQRSRLVSTTDVSTASELGTTVGVKAKDKGKVIMLESEPPKKIKKRVQVQMSVDEELAKKVFEEEQAKFKAEHQQEKSDFETALEL